MIQDAERLLRPGEVARLLNIHVKTVGVWAREGKLPSIRTLGGQRRIPASAVDALLNGVMAPQNEATGERVTLDLDLDRVERVINRPHIIDLRDDGFTLMHPPACHPRLFECEYNVIAPNNFRDPGKRGQYLCALIPGADHNPRFVIGDPAPDSEGVPWNALVAELRAAWDSTTALRTLLSTTICEPCYLQDWADSSTCDCQCHTDTDDARTTAQAALAAYDKVAGEADTDA